MDSVQNESFYLPSLHGWDEEFNTTRNVNRHIANKPYVAVQQAIQRRPGADIISYFVDTDKSETFPDQTARQIHDFCPNARTIENLLAEENAMNLPVALLDDSDSSGRHRIAYRHALPAKQLYDALRKPRLRRKRVGSGDAQDVSEPPLIKDDSVEHETDESKEPDAERRLVYITNLDQWTILVLAATASSLEAQPLRRGICKHLAFNASIDVFIPFDGMSTFTLSFHLPFYALRNSPMPAVKDRRRKSAEQPLRQFQDITFLGSDSPGFVYLYESQVSCIITGWDHSVWAAYLFIDLYYGGENPETLDNYEGEFEQLGAPTVADPLLRGEGIPIPIREPREYFLRCFYIRSKMAVNEWHRSVTHVLKNIKASVRFERPIHSTWTYKALAHFSQRDQYPRSKSDTGLTLETDDERSKRREFLIWSNRVIELLTKLSRGLEESIIAWRIFCASSVRYFYSPGAQQNISERDQRRLVAIQGHFTEITTLQRQVQLMIEELQDVTKDLKLRLANENNESAIMQQTTAQDVKYSIPFATVAAFLSTRDGFFPVPETPGSLLILLAIIETIVFLLFDKLSNWRWCGAFLRQVNAIAGLRHRRQQGVQMQIRESMKEEV